MSPRAEFWIDHETGCHFGDLGILNILCTDASETAKSCGDLGLHDLPPTDPCDHSIVKTRREIGLDHGVHIRARFQIHVAAEVNQNLGCLIGGTDSLSAK